MESPALPPQGDPARARRWRRLRRLVALPIAALVLAGCSEIPTKDGIPTFGAHPGATTSSHSAFDLWQGFSVGAIIIGFLVTFLIIWSVIRYRRKGDRIPKQTQYHLPLEFAYTIVPIMIVLGLFAATLVVENKEVANPKTSVIIDVNAFQWGWKFTYPGHNVVVVGQTTQNPEMVMPVNENVHINLTSSDVIHGFYVRAFNFSRYALPGVLNQFTFRAVDTGTYDGQCTQLCGLYHSLMWFRVKVVSDSDVRHVAQDQRELRRCSRGHVAATNQQTSSIVPTKPTVGNS